MINKNSNKQTINHPRTSDKDIVLKNIKEFFCISIVDDFFKEVINYAKENFEKFSAILIATLTIGLWIFRSLGYCYQSGVFSVYNIDNSYIEINDNFLFQMIQVLAFAIIFFLMNYIYIHLSLLSDTSKLHIKRRINKTIFILFEIISLFLIVMINNGSSLIDTYYELKQYSILNIISLLIVLILGIITFNILGIEVVLFARIEKKKKQTNDENEMNDQHNSNPISKITYLITFLIVMAILLLGSYFFGIIEERNRTKFKIIETQVEFNIKAKSEYIFKNSSDKVAYRLFPIVYENQDIYIVTRLYKDGDNIKIDTNYQKIIEKQNTETYTLNDINQLGNNFK